MNSIDQPYGYQYHKEQQLSRQWHPFLSALAVELQSAFPSEELCLFFRKLGKRMASQLSLETAHSLHDLETAINGIWRKMNWGWVRFQESEKYLIITHYFSPLSDGLGHPPEMYPVALLEGVYAGWISTLCNDPRLVLQPVQVAPDSDAIQFRFGVTKTQ
jgi:hypothetical protein